jgi:hypothetical protein
MPISQPTVSRTLAKQNVTNKVLEVHGRGSFVGRVEQVVFGEKGVSTGDSDVHDLTCPETQAELRDKFAVGWIPVPVDPGRRSILTSGPQLALELAETYLHLVQSGKWSCEFDQKLVITKDGIHTTYTFHHYNDGRRTVSNHQTTAKERSRHQADSVLFRNLSVEHYHRIIGSDKVLPFKEDRCHLTKHKQQDIVKRFFSVPKNWCQVIFFGDAKFNHASKGNRPSPNVTMRQ